MATVNKTIYPDETTRGNFQLTKTFNQYPLNTKLENSIQYSASGSLEYGRLRNDVVFFLKPSLNFFHMVQEPMNYSNVMLVSGETNYTRGWGYDNRFGYGMSDYTVHYTTDRPVTGFKYYDMIGVVQVGYLSSTSPATQTFVDLDTYFENYTDKPVTSVRMQVKSGAPNLRNSRAMFIGPMNDYNRYTFTSFNPEETDKNTEPFLNYLSNGSGPLTYTFMLMGTINLIANSYQNVWNKTTDCQFFNAGFPGINWDNIIQYPHSTRPMLYPEITITKEDCLHMAATIGILFTTNEDIATNLNLNAEILSKTELETNLSNDKLYFPIKEPSGVWNGKYCNGKDNLNTEQVKDNWNKDPNAPFDKGSPPIDQIDPNEYADKMPHGDGRGPINAFSKLYWCDSVTLQNFKDWFCDSITVDTIWEDFQNKFKFFNNDYTKTIVGCTYFPMSAQFSSGIANITLGKMETGVIAHNGRMTKNFNMGSCTINMYNSAEYDTEHPFMNFEPYTSYIFYAPFVGFYPLDARKIANKEISAEGRINFLSGEMTVSVYIGGTLETTLTANVGTNVSLNVLNSNEYLQNKFAKPAANIAAGAVGVGAALLAPSPVTAVAAIAGVSQIAKGVVDNWNTDPVSYDIGMTGGNNNTINNSTQAGIYKIRRTAIDSPEYGNEIGYACSTTMTLNEGIGYVECPNAVINCNGTSNEKSQLISLLANGIYI